MKSFAMVYLAGALLAPAADPAPAPGNPALPAPGEKRSENGPATQALLAALEMPAEERNRQTVVSLATAGRRWGDPYGVPEPPRDVFSPKQFVRRMSGAEATAERDAVPTKDEVRVAGWIRALATPPLPGPAAEEYPRPEAPTLLWNKVLTQRFELVSLRDRAVREQVEAVQKMPEAARDLDLASLWDDAVDLVIARDGYDDADRLLRMAKAFALFSGTEEVERDTLLRSLRTIHDPGARRGDAAEACRYLLGQASRPALERAAARWKELIATLPRRAK